MTNLKLYDDCTMGGLLIRAIQRGQDRVAFVSGERSITYRKFGEMLSRFTQAVKRHGIRRGDGIACLSSNSVEGFMATALGYLTGVRVTNLHPLGSCDDHIFMVTDAEVSALFFDPDGFADRAEGILAAVPGIKLLSFGASDSAHDILAEMQECEALPLQSTSELDDICWLLYTGGTSGRPKGVVHTHRTHLALTMAELAEWEWPAVPTFLAITPISHGAGACLMAVLMKSGTIVMENGFTPAKFFQVVAEKQVSATFMVPTMIYKLLDYARDHTVDASALELIIYGAAPIAPARLREAIALFGPVFMQLYGQSEAPNCVTILRKRDHVGASDARLASCGTPIFTSQVALLDDKGCEVAEGETGEICVRGSLVMRGYWKRPEETEKAFRFGWLHTGDLAKRDADGYIRIVGRSKDMIISGGFNVYPAEIEEVLTTHPSVSAAAVIGVHDDTWGEAVKAVVVLRPGEHASEGDLIRFVRDAKGPVCAPKSVSFAAELPLTSLGKPDKKALRQQYDGRAVLSA